ncbi:hypothetical protein XO47_15175 [Listeria monocytogenes]|nr:hypothetical protein [Listeria monocytogenes]
MKIGDVLNEVKKPGETIASVAKRIDGISEKPLRKVLKSAGYEFSNREPKGWIYIGQDPEPLEKSIFDFTTKATASKSTSNIKVIKSKDESKKESISNNKSESMDAIDVLLKRKSRKGKNKTYRGFYFDEDVLTVIDSIESGNKSELINEALRKVFNDKGLL